MHVKSPGKPCDSTSLLETLPGKLYIKRHSSSSLCLSVIIIILRYVIIFTLSICPSVCLSLCLSVCLFLALHFLIKISICLLQTKYRLLWYMYTIITIEKIYMVINCIFNFKEQSVAFNMLILLPEKSS